MDITDANDIRFTRLTGTGGLSHTRVGQIVQDDQGFMWFGTPSGLTRFDGYRYRGFAADPYETGGLRGVYVNALLKDHSGFLWIASDGFLDRLDPIRETFRHYSLTTGAPSANAIRVMSLMEDRAGVLWVSTLSGLYKLTPGSGSVVRFSHEQQDPLSLSSDSVKATGEDRRGNFWVVTSAGLDRFDRQTGKVTLRIPLAEPLEMGFHEDRFGTFWIYHVSGNALEVFDRTTNTLTHYSFREADGTTPRPFGIDAAIEDRDGTMWFGTGVGLLKYDRVLRRFVRYLNHADDPNSLGGDNVIALQEDREGQIWVALMGLPVNVFPARAPAFHKLPSRPDVDHGRGETMVNSVIEDSHGMRWMSYPGVLTRTDSRTGTQLSLLTGHSNGLAADVVSMTEDRRGRMWVGTMGGGISVYDPRARHLVTFRHRDSDPRSLSNDLVTRFLFDRDDRLWAATWDGVDRLDSDTGLFTVYRPPNHTEPQLYLDIAQDHSGAIWLGTDSSGLQRLDPATGAFTVYTYQAGQQGTLSNNRVNSVHVDHANAIWVGTQNGLDLLDTSTGRFTTYTERDGLPGHVVSCILEDRHGDLWISTNNGIARFDPRSKVFNVYSVADGLPGLDMTGWGSCFRNPSGDMLFAGFSGATRFSPEQISKSAYVPPVVLTDFKIAGASVPVGQGSPLVHAIASMREITLPYTQDNFSFEFSGLSFSSPSTNRYRYRLDGLDKGWHEVRSDQRLASYTTLPPGIYTFRVQSATSRGPWSEPGASVQITIKPAWWATWLFRTLLAVAALLTILALYLLRVRQVAARVRGRLEERMAERERIARELHDTLLQGIQGLVLSFQVVADRIPKGEPARDMIDRALERADQVLDEGRARVKALRAPVGGVPRLPQAVARIVEQLAPTDASSFRITVEGAVRELDPIVRDEVQLLTREALINAYRHANAGKIEAEIAYADDGLTVRIRDDGQGMDGAVLRDGRPGHFGLLGMRERAKKIRARLGIWSKPGAGTEVEIRVPAAIAYPQSARRARRKPWWRSVSTPDIEDAALQRPTHDGG